MQGNGYARPFEIKEFRNLMMSSFLFQTGVYVSYFLYLVDNPKKDLTAEDFFFYGACAAFLPAGIISDFIFQGRSHFLVLGIFIVIAIANQIYLTVKEQYFEWVDISLGFI
jgi:sugar phosphate permease